MGDKFYAETQYGDLVGTAAFDGHKHPPLFELTERSNMPSEGYWPIGFELFRLDPNEDGKIPFALLAVKCEEAGDTIDDIIKYAKAAKELSVYRFEGELKPTEFSFLFKRIDIKAARKDLPHAKIDLCYPPE